MLDGLDCNLCMLGGQGAPVVLAHGYGCDQTVWKDVAPPLSARHRVVLFDHAGCGLADPALYDRQRHARLQGYAGDVVRLLAHLGLGPVRFVGHSVSSMIGALAALERPDLFAELVMIGPSACYLDEEGYHGGFSRDMVEDLLTLMDRNFLGWAASFAPIATGNPDRPDLARDFAQRLQRNDPEIASAFARATFFSDTRALLPRLRVPVLILQSPDDPIAPETAVDFVHRAIPGSRLVRLDSSGHCPHISHPQAVVAALRAAFDTPPPQV